MSSEQGKKPPMKQLFSYLYSYRKALWVAIGASILNKIVDLMPPFITSWLIDGITGKAPAWMHAIFSELTTEKVVLSIVVLTILTFGLESITEWIFKRSFMRVAQRAQHDLRMDAYRTIQQREMAFFETQRTGNLMSILNDDVNQLERFLNSVFNEIIQLLTLLLFAGWSLFHINPWLGLISLSPVPFIVWGSIYYQRSIAPFYKRIREEVGMLNSRLENNIGGMAVIKSFAREDFEYRRVEAVSKAYREANFNAIRWNAVYIPAIRMLIAFGFAVSIGVAAYWAVYNPSLISIGEIAFFAMMTQRMLWPVTRLGAILDDYERAKSAARRVFGLFAEKPTISDAVSPLHVEKAQGHIAFSDVSFDYQPAIPLFRNLSFTLAAGKTLGIAGATGGGKTTLVKLLLRLYEVDEGAILLDGINIKDIALADLRHQFAVVGQDVYLFHGTIYENIAYGLPDCPLADVVAVAQKAQLHDFVASLPEGYDTLVGERGIKLSGGQRQRLSIARALLTGAPVLILDEATSAVDTETERIIQDNLQLLTAEKTAIIIAHRLSTIRHADHILVLDSGRIVEQGTHTDLLAKKGVYAGLWNGQSVG